MIDCKAHIKTMKNYKHRAWRKKIKLFWRKQRQEYHQKINNTKQCLSDFSKNHIKQPTLTENRFEDILIKLNLIYLKQPFLIKKDLRIIPDFVLEHPYYLVIEIDGEYHRQIAQIKKDRYRDKVVGSFGYDTWRFKNQEVLENPQAVEQRLLDILKKRKFWNSCCKFKRIFWGGASSAIKPTKPIGAEKQLSA